MSLPTIRDRKEEIVYNEQEFFQWKGMGKGTAAWLIENTALTFEQIADFCGIHMLQVQAIADDELNEEVTPIDPIAAKLLDEETIEACTADKTKRLTFPMHNSMLSKFNIAKKNKSRYVTLTKKKDKPDAISWLLKNYPYISEKQIIKLIGTTKNTIQAIKDKTYKGIKSLKSKNPVSLGLCSEEQLESTAMYARMFHDRQQIENEEKINHHEISE